MAPDPLAGARWTCGSTRPGEVEGPGDLATHPVRWLPAEVPGTVAGALASAGVPERSSAELDAEDWWFRCRFAGSGGGPWALALDGLATVGDVWLNGEHVHHGESMFAGARVPVALGAGNELVICCRALAPRLEERRPRPRWKSGLATHQGLRWFRTTLLGRQPGWTVTPAPVGPWRPVRLVDEGEEVVRASRLRAWCDGEDGLVAVELHLGAGVPGDGAEVRVGGHAAALVPAAGPDGTVLRGEVRVPGVDRWWPHTHGAQPRHAVAAVVAGARHELGSVGFRTVAVDRDDGGFRISVNGVPVFCRGACWFPVDPVTFAAPPSAVRETLVAARDAGMNMVRIPGGTVYEGEAFFEACDELGIMVWQDCMLGFLDPPDDAAFVAGLVDEVDGVLGALGGHPSLAVVCGGQEVEEQAAMFGLPPERRSTPLLEETLPHLVAALLPGVPYVTSSPSGGEPPFRADRGVTHYAGIGSYLRSPDDARLSGVRFVSEGLAFAVPPERRTVDGVFGGPGAAGHDPGWKRAVHHDTGRPFDLEDVRDHYVAALWGVDPRALRMHDPGLALDLGRATVAELVAGAAAEWRRPGSTCDGMLAVALRDLRPGAGWGLLDAFGRPKSSYYALARLWQPVAVLVVDEGLNGVRLHVVNDRPEALACRLRVDLYAERSQPVESGGVDLVVPARGGACVEAWELVEGFRDVGWSYRFGDPVADTLVATVCRAPGDEVVAEAVHPLVRRPPASAGDPGLSATAVAGAGGAWALTVTTERAARWVSIDVPGFRPDDSWFHLAPGGTRTVGLRAEDRAPGEPDGRPRGSVCSLDATSPVRIVV